ncbi:hypothetical protein CYMTET_48946 [Cymbomonas tetramitiformis]|uniref:Uncharacterized protein n=1 Tax=Cymbomonas tetramitiformis TaxID=36881 RepID=A0AAE0BR69_9CHLO|nr:hypothetical protein CYMTET_48946 [Cymbomonas tetramitiformis]
MFGLLNRRWPDHGRRLFSLLNPSEQKLLHDLEVQPEDELLVHFEGGMSVPSASRSSPRPTATGNLGSGPRRLERAEGSGTAGTSVPRRVTTIGKGAQRMEVDNGSQNPAHQQQQPAQAPTQEEVLAPRRIVMGAEPWIYTGGRCCALSSTVMSAEPWTYRRREVLRPRRIVMGAEP